MLFRNEKLNCLLSFLFFVIVFALVFPIAIIVEIVATTIDAIYPKKTKEEEEF